ncbi:TPA: recombinase family protein, partial [Listeria monocytogenes]|nr:recombinase family protein [Listeria monocytogenes]HEM2251880.1 recombinase family protein [Listeria monocytogenes]
MTVGIYIRVSTEEQVKEGFSISAQKEKLKAYCTAQGWEDFKFYVDEGKSAK